MTTTARRREGRRIRRRAQGKPYTTMVTIYPDLTDFPQIFAVIAGHRYLIGTYPDPRTAHPLIHNGRKPR